ncbi:hypothetical protein [Mycobacterium sp. IDR2000157661]|uniref:hypothetical protein n=1 Tax=Mycobacterium sp. IDR2000157661 TaxID=2867005 RepID=UPI001EEC06BC|nr:hypothetical protein [Mycobacterium sp. IDR2000157661]ULE31862.1 hypothetical protein K3G64_16950 [Mycobacterium sp. IDR2000157661]
MARGSRLLEEPRSVRERWADEILDRLSPIMGVLGIVFVLLVLGEQLARPGPLSVAMAVLSWMLWAVFAVEFVARLVVTPDTGAFLRRNWWQIIFLVLPFLRLLRLLRIARLTRSGRVLSGAVRGSRSAQAVLGSRLAGLGSVVAITVLGSSQLLFEFSDYPRYADALHAAALGAITGEPLQKADGFALAMDVVLAVFSVVVFGALAGLLGSFFIESRDSEKRAAAESPEPD